MTLRRYATCIFAVGIFLVFAVNCFAEQLSISGTVRDSGGVVPEANVSLRTVGEAPRMTMTDRMGVYAFSGLAPGFYELSSSRHGYDTVTRTFSLTSASTAPVDITFALGAVATSVTVTDSAGKGTAARLDVPDRDLPVQINSIPQELLQQQGVNDMTLALRNASGVQAQQVFGLAGCELSYGHHFPAHLRSQCLEMESINSTTVPFQNIVGA